MIHFVTSYQEHRKSQLKTILPKLIDSGLKTVQFAWGNCTDKEYIETACWVRKLTQDNNVTMIVNNRLDVALACDADGLHIGKNDIPYDIAKEYMKNKKIGVTIYNESDLIKYKNSTVDYFGYGPIFTTRTHITAQPPVGLAKLKQVCDVSEIPVVAIGGITHKNIKNVYDSGANEVAIIGDLYYNVNEDSILRKLFEES